MYDDIRPPKTSNGDMLRSAILIFALTALGLFLLVKELFF